MQLKVQWNATFNFQTSYGAVRCGAVPIVVAAMLCSFVCTDKSWTMNMHGFSTRQNRLFDTKCMILAMLKIQKRS